MCIAIQCRWKFFILSYFPFTQRFILKKSLPVSVYYTKKRKIKKNGKRFERHDDDGDDVKVKKSKWHRQRKKKMIEKRVLNDRQHGKKEMCIKTTKKQKVDSKWAFKRDGG